MFQHFQVSLDRTGGVHSVLNRRRGEILSKESIQGTPHVNIKAYLPVNESFGMFLNSRHSNKGTSMLNFYDIVRHNYVRIMVPELILGKFQVVLWLNQVSRTYKGNSRFTKSRKFKHTGTFIRK